MAIFMHPFNQKFGCCKQLDGWTQELPSLVGALWASPPHLSLPLLDIPEVSCLIRQLHQLLIRYLRTEGIWSSYPRATLGCASDHLYLSALGQEATTWNGFVMGFYPPTGLFGLGQHKLWAELHPAVCGFVLRGNCIGSSGEPKWWGWLHKSRSWYKMGAERGCINRHLTDIEVKLRFLCSSLTKYCAV